MKASLSVTDPGKVIDPDGGYRGCDYLGCEYHRSHCHGGPVNVRRVWGA